MNEVASPATIRNNRLKLLALWLIPFGLMAAAAVVYWMVQAGHLSLGSKNEGVLISPPQQLGELALLNKEGESAAHAWDNKWTILVRGGASCDQACMDTLYITRQIHIRLDKNANRVQRVYLSHDASLASDLQAHIDAEHHYLRTIYIDRAEAASLDQALAGGDDVAPRFYIVDPQGWAMMYYLDQHDAAAVLKDLKHLLKFSRDK